MKKFVAFLLALVMCLGSVSALAGGNVTIQQLNFRVIDDLWHTIYGYAKVVNDGDAAIYLDNGLMQVWDAEGGMIISEDYMDAYAACLQPGEYTYIKLECDLEEGMADPATAEITLGGEADYYTTNLRLPVETKLELGVSDGWWDYNYMYATVTNNTEETLYDIQVVLVLLDAAGNILYMADESLYDEIGVAPGSTIVIREDIYTSFMEYFESNGIVPASVDAIAYVDVEVDY
ncbi:MAG: hypothetical protein IKT57_01500 [Clostridia bacterium]|nr:hypothetical protein [Clostridia bacterium]